MLTEYIEAAMRKAKYEMLPDDNTFYGYIPGFDGVYANSDDLETCRRELNEVLEEWILLSISRHLPLPAVEEIELTIKDAVQGGVFVSFRGAQAVARHSRSKLHEWPVTGLVRLP